MSSAGEVCLGINQRSRLFDNEPRVRNVTSVPTGDYRLGQVLQVAIRLKAYCLTHRGVVVAHLGKFSGSTRREVYRTAATQCYNLLVAVAIDVWPSRREDIDARHIGQLLVEIEGLLNDEWRTTLPIAQDGPPIGISLKAEPQESLFAVASRRRTSRRGYVALHLVQTRGAA